MQNSESETSVDAEEEKEEGKEEKKIIFPSGEVGGLRIRNLNYLFILFLALFAIILFIVTMRLSSGYEELIRTTDEYHRIEEDARMVQTASDDLTKYTQLYVTTGDSQYLDAYFLEADVTKRRENAIRELEELKVTESLVLGLEDSVKESLNLMLLEYKAMRYAAEGYEQDTGSLPNQIQKTDLPVSDRDMSDKEKLNEAQEIVFGQEFANYEMSIRDYQEKYLQQAIELMDVIQDNQRRRMEKNILIQRLSIAFIIFLGILVFLAIARLVVNPLHSAVDSISRGDLVSPVKGTREIRYLSQTYNEYHQDSTELQQNLKLEAERDALTGVLNRRGYRMIVERLKKENYPIALLVMDIDHFKYVNDSYGHRAGDLALKMLANGLLRTFRESDIISRIGGDEFTVIMSGVTEANKGIIEQKIASLNRALSIPDSDDCPPVSVSVGASFSENGYTEVLFADADSRMYKSKNSGGSSVSFN